MQVYSINGSRVGVSNIDEILEKKYEVEQVDLSKGDWSGSVPKEKSDKAMKILYAPYSMHKLLKLLEIDEYHSGCVDAIAKNVIMKFECSNQKVKDWFIKAQFPKRTNGLKLLRQMVKYNAACGNGQVLKSRNRSGEWVGLERLLPTEMQLVESFNKETGYLEPDYIQTRMVGGSQVKKYHKNEDVIHFLEETHKSEAWGLSSVPVAINTEILGEIKKFDYNNFKNGLMIDYIIIVEGGSIKDDDILDENGDPIEKDGKNLSVVDVLNEQLKLAKGNELSHSTILLESGEQNVKIRLERLRQEVKDGGFQNLKKDLREGIFAYHRVPPRVVSMLVQGQLGGDNNSDLTLFYENKVKPIQWDMAVLLADEFNREFSWNVSPDEFDFGDLTEAFLSENEKFFEK